MSGPHFGWESEDAIMGGLERRMGQETLTNDTLLKSSFWTAPARLVRLPLAALSLFPVTSLRPTPQRAVLEGSNGFLEGAFSGTFFLPPHTASTHPPRSWPKRKRTLF